MQDVGRAWAKALILLAFLGFTTGCVQGMSELLKRAQEDDAIGGAKTPITLTLPSTVEVDEGDTATLTFQLSQVVDSSKSYSYSMLPSTAVAGTNYTSHSGTLLFNPSISSQSISLSTQEIGFVGATSKDLQVRVFDSDGVSVGAVTVKIKPKAQYKTVANLKIYQPDTLQYIDMGAYVLFAKWTAANGTELWKSDGTTAGTALLKDICSGTCSSDIRDFVKIGAAAYFIAKPSTSSTNYSIYKTDGTAVGTAKIFDLSQVSNTANPATEKLNHFQNCPPLGACSYRYLIANSSRIFFMSYNSADTPLTAVRIYSSQGTVGTTFRVDAGADDSPYDMRVFNDRLFVSREDEVFIWPGTATGGATTFEATVGWPCVGYANTTKEVAGDLYTLCMDMSTATLKVARIDTSFNAIYFGITSSFYYFGTGYQYYYHTLFNAGQYHLRATDATLSNTVFSSATDLPQVIGYVGTTTLFTAGSSLYKTNGTAGGTSVVKALGSSINSGLGTVGAKAYLYVSGQLWETDLTGGGTVQVLSTDGESFLDVSLVKETASGLYLRGRTASRGYELWRINTSNVLQLVSEVKSGSSHSNPGEIVTIGGSEYFTSVDTASSALYSIAVSPAAISKHAISGWSAGTSETTLSFYSESTKLHWTQNSESHAVALKTYSVAAGSASVANIDELSAQRPKIIGAQGGKVLLQGYYPSVATMGPVGALVDLVSSVVTALTSPGEYPKAVTGLQMPTGVLYMGVPAGQFNDAEPHFINTSSGATTLLADIVVGAGGSTPNYLGKLGAWAYFVAGTAGSRGLYKTDGSSANTSLVVAINSTTEESPVVASDKIYFVATVAGSGKELWVTDGTAGGTGITKDINSGGGNAIGGVFRGVAFGSSIVFYATDGTNGSEPWISNGTSAGTSMIKDMCAGACSASIDYFVALGSKVYFWEAVDNPTSTNMTYSKLWRTDGTLAGTVAVEDLRPSSITSAKNTPLSQVFIVTDNTTTGLQTYGLWRFRPSVNSEPEPVPGYTATSPTLKGTFAEWAVLEDKNADNRDTIYLAK